MKKILLFYVLFTLLAVPVLQAANGGNGGHGGVSGGNVVVTEVMPSEKPIFNRSVFTLICNKCAVAC